MVNEWLDALIGSYPTGRSEVTLAAKNIPLGNTRAGILGSVDVEQLPFVCRCLIRFA
jgi:hypothetical protein